MGGAIQTCRIAKMTRYKRSAEWRKSTNSMKRATIGSSRPAPPFNGTTSLIRQRSQQQKESEWASLFGELGSMVDQYGSNSKDVIACCTFATNNHEQGCNYKSQADHPVIIGLSPRAPARNHSNLHSELQAKLQVTGSLQPERIATHHPPLHHCSNHGASSAGIRKPLEDLAISAVHERGQEMIKHRSSRSFTADHIVPSSASCAETLDEIVDEDLRNNFCALGIQEARTAGG